MKVTRTKIANDTLNPGDLAYIPETKEIFLVGETATGTRYITDMVTGQMFTNWSDLQKVTSYDFVYDTPTNRATLIQIVDF